MNDVITRALKTLIQSAIGCAAVAALSAIGTANVMGAVDWQYVASSACLAAVVSLLMNMSKLKGDDNE